MPQLFINFKDLQYNFVELKERFMNNRHEYFQNNKSQGKVKENLLY